MFIVAVAEVSGDAEIEARELAPELGMVAYDLRLALAGIPPRVVVRVPTREGAEQAMGILRARGHGVIVCEAREVVPSSEMTQVRAFGVDDYALHADAARGPSLPWSAIGALIRVVTNVRAEQPLSDQRLIADDNGSIRIIHHDAPRTRRELTTEEALYIVPTDGAPWILRAGSARYAALGERQRPTTRENFDSAVALLRERAGDAPYDDRFVAHPLDTPALARTLPLDPRAATPRMTQNDLTIHLLSRFMMRERGGPYRG